MKTLSQEEFVSELDKLADDMHRKVNALLARMPVAIEETQLITAERAADSFAQLGASLRDRLPRGMRRRGRVTYLRLVRKALGYSYP